MTRILVLAGLLAAILVVVLVGLRVPAAPFPEPPRTAAPATVPIPRDLPAPVARFYRGLYGDAMPIAENVVLTGRARLRILGISMPARWRFTHDVGRGYRHEIVATWFGLPLFVVDERYLDGVAEMRLPFGIVETGATVDQGANLALWAEAMWFPAALATDPRVRWEVVDDATAMLHVPHGGDSETFIARFDPTTTRLTVLEAMRYKGADATSKTLWLTRAEAWGDVGGHPTMTTASVQWLDEAQPWATFHVDHLRFGVDDLDARLGRTP